MYNIVCNTNTTTNANEIKALTRFESENSVVDPDPELHPDPYWIRIQELCKNSIK